MLPRLAFFVNRRFESKSMEALLVRDHHRITDAINDEVWQRHIRSFKNSDKNYTHRQDTSVGILAFQVESEILC